MTVLTDEEVAAAMRASWIDGDKHMPGQALVTARAIEAAVMKKLDAKHLAVEEAQAEQHQGLQTSLIRAGMAAVCESILNSDYDICTDDGTRQAISVTIDLEAQRTVWDRVELTTDRTPDEKSVVFTVTRK